MTVGINTLVAVAMVCIAVGSLATWNFFAPMLEAKKEELEQLRAHRDAHNDFMSDLTSQSW